VLTSAFHNVTCRKGLRSCLSRLKWCWRSTGTSRLSTMMMEWKRGPLQMAAKSNREEGQHWTANGLGSLWRTLQGKLFARSLPSYRAAGAVWAVNIVKTDLSWCCFLCSKPMPVVDQSKLMNISDPVEYFMTLDRLEGHSYHFRWFVDQH